jgi:phosphatidylserine synthase
MKDLCARMFIYRNLPNIVSILGVLPLAILFADGGFQYLIPLIIYNNIMDDLDGILAVKLDLKSDFGAGLDNVCDAVAHIIFVMAVGMHYGYVCGVVCLVAVISILLRVVSRITSPPKKAIGSPTNELIRHMLFVLLIAMYLDFNPMPFLLAVFILNAASMLLPFQMRYLIRGLTKSAIAIGFVNISLVVAWLIPPAAPAIAFGFFATYLYSFIAGGVWWLKKAKT